MNTKWGRLLSALTFCGAVTMTGIFIGCDAKAKQKAFLVVDAAKLSLADAKNAKAERAAPTLMREAESNLIQAQKALDKKDYAKASKLADSASMKAREAAEQAKKKTAIKKLKPTSKVSKTKKP